MQPMAEGTTEATLSLQFDLLVETEPDSGQFFRQTVLDTLTLSFAPPTSSKDQA
jgi:hypothetical protein